MQMSYKLSVNYKRVSQFLQEFEILKMSFTQSKPLMNQEEVRIFKENLRHTMIGLVTAMRSLKFDIDKYVYLR